MQLQFLQQGAFQPVAYNFEPPTDCPQCHKGIIAVVVGNGGYIWQIGTDRAAMYLFACPRESCRTGFVALWSYDSPTSQWSFAGAYPSAVEPSTKSRFIENVSPTFYTIFDEARAAEHHRLSEIAGMGYRKALEFLIKDYLVSKSAAEQHEKIKAKMLGSCISEYVTDQRIKSVAERAVWLGNDETHYARRWNDHDITDLKRLIDLTTKWIEMELETQEALESMPKP